MSCPHSCPCAVCSKTFCLSANDNLLLSFRAVPSWFPAPHFCHCVCRRVSSSVSASSPGRLALPRVVCCIQSVAIFSTPRSKQPWSYYKLLLSGFPFKPWMSSNFLILCSASDTYSSCVSWILFNTSISCLRCLKKLARPPWLSAQSLTSANLLFHHFVDKRLLIKQTT